MRRIILVAVFCLSACGGNTAEPKISRADMPQAEGLTYQEFRSRTSDEGSHAAQKRFLTLDKDNNGRISNAEMRGR